MIKLENYTKKYKLIIFDLDGVLINSKENMRLAWNGVNKKFKTQVSFQKYFDNIGMPFIKILKKVGINKNFEEIKNLYSKISIENSNKIIFYKDVEKVLKYLISQRYKIGIVTSKDKKRTNLFLSKLNIKFDCIVCPQKRLKGKPYPDQLKFLLNKLKIDEKYSVYIGDTITDSKAAKSCNIDFIFASYGYGISKSKKMKRITSLKKLIDIL